MSQVATHDPFESSLFGEYARLLLIGTAACTAAAWTMRIGTGLLAYAMVLANIFLAGVALSDRFPKALRLAVPALLATVLLSLCAMHQERAIFWSPIVVFSPVVTVAALLTLLAREGVLLVRNRTTSVSPGKIVVVGGIIALSTYMLLIPAVNAIVANFRERPQSYVLEDLSLLEILRIRSAELVVFSIFAYAGACVGSFLHVVAASAPRAESIVLRSSACPVCGSPIRRIDNLPIVSYLRLGGRCRECGSSIPSRYLYAELAGFGIFAALFLYELITGGANIPEFPRYHYAGVVWIILYTKWSVVGVYLFHCALFCCLLMLAFMEHDRLRPPLWMRLFLPASVAGLVIAWPNLLPVSLVDQTPLQWPASLPSWLDRAVNCTAGGILGWLVGHFAQRLRLRRRQSTSLLAVAFSLVGMALGWQAVLTIAAVWLLTTSLLKLAGGRRLRPQWLTATGVLLLACMLHHPAWRWIAETTAF
jgi:leader peptidase (prepilin peptidase)/N-methyltransferase